MKKLLLLLLISILVFAGSVYLRGFSLKKGFLMRSVCDKPVAYRIGNIDSRFNLSEKDVQTDLENAEGVWEGPSSRNLFVYDVNAKLQVNFVYDKKQGLNTQINQLEGQLNAGKGDLEAMKAEYEKEVDDFNKQVDELNNQVQYWNNQGGAPKEEYDKLIARQKELGEQAQKLTSQARELNLSAQQYNLNVGKLNQRISEFNEDLKRKPEEGLYDGANTVEIYFVTSKQELVHTLAHELGHARGLGHVENDTESIMFPYTSESVKTSVEDIDAIDALCRQRSLLEIFQDNLNEVGNRYFNPGL